MEHVEIRESVQGFSRLSYDATSDAPWTTLVTSDQASNSHGTCMASCAGGLLAGVFKKAEIVPIKVIAGDLAPKLQTLMDAVAIAMFDTATHPSPAGVMSMSIGFLVAELRVAAGQPANTIDPFKYLIDEAVARKIVPVASSGNSATANEDLNDATPRRNGGPDKSLIVVGNCQYDGDRWYQSTYLDRDSTGILSIYAPGVKIQCAKADITATKRIDKYQTQTGSSPATAIVAGMVALYISQGRTDAKGAKAFLLSESRRLKGDWPSDGAGAGQAQGGPPRAAMASQIACAGKVQLPVQPTWVRQSVSMTGTPMPALPTGNVNVSILTYMGAV